MIEVFDLREYTVSLRATEGIYHVRIYTIPNYYDDNAEVLSGSRPGSLPFHHWCLTAGRLKYTRFKLSPLDIKSIGGAQVSSDGELLQGVPRFGQMPIELHASDVFQDLVECVRQITNQVWIEMVLEQPHQGLPGKLDPFFLQPRKKMMYYWGRLDRHAVTQAIKYQKLDRGFVNTLRRGLVSHDGTLKLSFMHWLKARGMNSAKKFLDDFKASRPHDQQGATLYAPMDAILNGLLAAISPTNLYCAADHRLQEPFEQLGISYRLDIELPFKAGDGATMLHNVRDLELRYSFWADGSPKHSALFFNDPGGNNSQSFYKWKDLAQGLFEFTRELLLFPQVEIPTMEQAATAPPGVANTPATLAQYWPAATRWLMTTYEDPPLNLYVDADEATIEITPAAMWASQYKVELPTVEGLLPAPAYSIVRNGSEGGSDQGFKTLFRTIGQTYVTLNGVQTLIDSPRGWEISFAGPVERQYVSHFEYGEITYTNWATFHASVKMDLWGSVRSTLALKCHGVAIEPYGDSLAVSSKTQTIVDRSFGFNDFGEFPLFRKLLFRGGLIVDNEKDLIEYLLYDIERTPNGGTTLKLIEIKQFRPPEPSAVYEPPPPVPPEVDPPDEDPPTAEIQDPTANETVSGSFLVKVNATDAVGVSQVKLYLDGALFDFSMYPATGNEYQFAWDTTLSADGVHSLKAVAYDAAGNSSSHVVPVTVDNTP